MTLFTLSYLAHHPLTFPATNLELINYINKLPKRKTHGIVGFLNSILFKLPINFVFYLACIINAILKHHYFPPFFLTHFVKNEKFIFLFLIYAVNYLLIDPVL